MWPPYFPHPPAAPTATEPDPLPPVTYRRCMECSNLTAYQCAECAVACCPRSECLKDHKERHR